jgi:hypothetical protein
MKYTKIFIVISFFSTMLLSSCASVMNLHNNHSWQMGIDIVTTSADPVKVIANGKECKTELQYKSDYFYVTRALLTQPKKNLKLEITQGTVTKTADLHCDKIKGLFWVEGLFVIVDHVKGTLIKYPAVEFDKLPTQ